MAKYIKISDALAICRKWNKACFESNDSKGQWCAETIEDEILDIPTADVVEVVRCEKCKYFREYSDAHKRAVERADGDCFLKLTHSCDEQFIACRYNDFCSYGVRK